MPQMTAQTLLEAVRGSPSALPLEARRWIDYYARAPLRAPSNLPAGQAGALYVSTDELRSVDERADAKIRAVDMAVAACDKLSDPDRANWNAFLLKWKDLHAKNQDIIHSTLGLGAGDALAATNATYDSVASMQDRVSGACPKVIGGIGGPSSATSWTNVILIVAVLAAVVTGLWIFSPLIAAAARPRALSQGPT